MVSNACLSPIIALVLCCAVCLPHALSAGVQTRLAQFGQNGGIVEAKGLEDGRLTADKRRLLTRARGAPVVYLLGYNPTTKGAVSSMLTKVGASVLQPAPNSHWLVKGTPSAIRSVQDKYPSVTASLVPKQLKTSARINQYLQEAAQGERGSNAHHARVLQQNTGASFPPHKGLRTYNTSDGRTQLVLEVDGPPFITVNKVHSKGPEREAAKEEAQAWAAELKEGVLASLGLHAGDACEPVIASVSILGWVNLVVCSEHVQAAVSWLTEQGTVIHVDLQHAAQLHNLIAGDALQNGPQSSVLPDDFVSQPNLFPFWAAGITGEGQLVGVADTWIDMGSCYFWDPEFADYETNQSNIKMSPDDNGVEFQHFFNTNNRKVISYFWLIEPRKTNESGHGTHVSGTINGAVYGYNPITNPDLATGIAPKAKLVFFDIDPDLNGQNTLVLPGDCIQSVGNTCTLQAKGSITSIFELQRNEGALISSNSWGTTSFGYTSQCKDIDAFARENDMLLVFAAGNSGTISTSSAKATGTVGFPATCKNVLAIGAANNFRENYGKTIPNNTLLNANGKQITVKDLSAIYATNRQLLFYVAQSNGDKVYETSLIEGVPQYFPWARNTGIIDGIGINQDFELALANPEDACQALSGDYSNKIVVFVKSSNCDLDTSGSNVANTDAVAGVCVDSSYALSINANGVKSFSMPLVTIPDIGLTKALTDNEIVYLATMGGSPQQYVTYFSSYGPTLEQGNNVSSQDVRIMPQLTAPGATLSAYTNGVYNASQTQCTPLINEEQGTSMACPVVAGAAALMRQYFLDGFYPTGARNASNTMDTTASLLRALLVAGANSMTGLAERDAANLTPLDVNQGFGLVDLSRSLPLENVTDENWRLQVWQNESFSLEGQSQSFSVEANGQHPLIVSMAYLDLPGEPNHYPILTNDLDLMVTAPDGTVSWGNGKTGGDRSNNIERVVIESPPQGNYTIQVTAHNLMEQQGGQNYSVVALGGVGAASMSSGFSSTGEINNSFSGLPDEKNLGANEREVDVEYTMAALNEAVKLGNTSSDAYQVFKTGTDHLFASTMGQGSTVNLVGLAFGSSSGHRSLLQNLVVTGRYIMAAPAGTSSHDTKVMVDTVLHQLANNGAYLDQDGLNVFQIQSASGKDITPNGAGNAHVGLGAFLSAFLGVVLLMTL